MRALLWSLSAFVVPGYLLAQSDSMPRRTTCWRGRPAPQCHAFWLTEITGEYAFASTMAHYRQVYSTPNGSFEVREDRRDISSRLVWTVGPMFNTSPTHAVGATLTAGFDAEGGRLAVEARRRTWNATDGGSAFDLSAGIVRANLPFRTDPVYGLTAGAYVGGADLIHLTARGDLLASDGRLHLGGAVGAGFGSRAAAGATAVLLVLTAALIAAVANSHLD